MLLHEYEYKIKEHRLKRVIWVLAVVCVVSLATLGANAWRAEQIRQNYVRTIVSNLHNLEVMVWGFYNDVENGIDPIETSRWQDFENTARWIDNDVRRLSAHRNVQTPTGMSMSMHDFHWHTFTLIQQANNGQPEEAIDFLSRRSNELLELIAELSVEWEEEWQGEIVTLRDTNMRLTTRQFFNRMNRFTSCVAEERQQNLHRQRD